MYIEKKNILFAWTVFCVCSLFSLKTVRAESIIGTYRSDSLGDVLYISEDKGEKTESEKQADAEVLEKDPFALESGEEVLLLSLSVLLKSPGIVPAESVQRVLERGLHPEEWRCPVGR